MLCAICRSTFTRQFSRVLTPGPSSLDFSRESPAKDIRCYVAYVYNGELVSLIGNQWVGIFPPKSRNSLPLIISFEMISKLPRFELLLKEEIRGLCWKKGICFPHGKSGSWNFHTKNQERDLLLPEAICFIWYRKKSRIEPSPLGGVTWPKYAKCWPVRQMEGIIV